MKCPILLSVLLLGVAGCASEDTATETLPQPAQTAAPNSDRVTRDMVLATTFIADYREHYPDLARDRTDDGIANDGVRICEYIIEAGAERGVVLRRMAAALERNGITPDAATTIKIMRLGVKAICPEPTKMFKAFVA